MRLPLLNKHVPYLIRERGTKGAVQGKKIKLPLLTTPNHSLKRRGLVGHDLFYPKNQLAVHTLLSVEGQGRGL